MQVHAAAFCGEVLADDVQQVSDVEGVAAFKVTRELMQVRLDLLVTVCLGVCLAPSCGSAVGHDFDVEEVLASAWVP